MNQQYRSLFGKIPTDWEGLSLKEVHEGKNKMINPQSFPSETFELYSIPAYYETHKPELKVGKLIQSTKLLVERNTILFGKINPRNPKVWKVDCNNKNRRIASTEFIFISPNKDTSFDFIYHILSSDTLIEKSKTLISGTTPSRARIEPRRFYDLIIPYPPLKEQQKIASILSKIDELIQKTDKIIQDTLRLKKGLTLRLLTRGIRNTKFEKTEFGEIPAEWKVVPVDSFLKINMGQSPPSKTYNDKNNGLPFYQGVSDFGEMFPTPRVWCSSPKKTANANEILFSVRAPVGELNLTKEKCCIGRGIASLIPIHSDIKYCFFLLELFSNKFGAYSQGSTFSAINRNEIGKVKLPFATDIKEQQEIASILCNVYSLLQKQRHYNYKLVDLKKGLTQKLLTGKVRVKA